MAPGGGGSPGKRFQGSALRIILSEVRELSLGSSPLGFGGHPLRFCRDDLANAERVDRSTFTVHHEVAREDPFPEVGGERRLRQLV